MNETRAKTFAFLGKLFLALLLALGWIDLDDVKETLRPAPEVEAARAEDEPGRDVAAPPRTACQENASPRLPVVSTSCH